MAEVERGGGNTGYAVIVSSSSLQVVPNLSLSSPFIPSPNFIGKENQLKEATIITTIVKQETGHRR